MDKIKVIIVDDSAVVRGLITKTLQKNPYIDVITTAFNGEVGVTYFKKYKPDVTIMDIEMPVMDGMTALKEIITLDQNAKIIVVSTLSTKNAEVTLQAFEEGAADCLAKPSSNSEMDAYRFQMDIIQRVLSIGGFAGDRLNEAMAETLDFNAEETTPNEIGKIGIENKIPNVSYATKTHKNLTSSAHQPTLPAQSSTPSIRAMPDKKPYYKIIAIGSSTGGPKALFKVLSAIGPINLPIVITQHMPPTFTTMLAKHIEDNTGLNAVEGEEGMLIEPRKIYVAPGGKHMTFIKETSALRIKLDNGPPESFCKPSVDVMLRSLVNIYNGNILSVILTGMGNDGARSCQLMVDHGGVLIAQDQETSVVWGMPGAVARAGLCHHILPLEKIGNKVKQLVGGS